jgi:AcrR family transcriptional regulator
VTAVAALSRRPALEPARTAVTARFTVRQGNRRGAEARTRLTTILDVARRLFLKRGYANTSLNDVVALAGGSKATVLKYFGNKAGLFASVIADVSKRFVVAARLADIHGTPAQVLQAYGEIVLKFYLANESLVAYRGVVAEGRRYPSMARAFYQQGHVLVEAALAERLTEWQRMGLVSSINGPDDADLFLHLVRAGLYEQRLLGIRRAPTPDEIAARVARGVQVFLHGITPPSARPRRRRS